MVVESLKGYIKGLKEDAKRAFEPTGDQGERYLEGLKEDINKAFNPETSKKDQQDKH